MNYVFFRNDDVYNLSKEFLLLDKLCAKYNLPMAYGVIPKKLTPDCAEYLNVEQHNRSLEILQHGFEHKNHLSNGIKSEFPRERTREQQEKDILNGKKILDQYFQNKTYAFVPPFHNYDLKTLTIVNKYFEVFSARGRSPNLNHWNFVNVPVDIHLNYFDEQGNYILHKLPEMMKEFKKACATNKVVGICLHHHTLTEQNISYFINFIHYVQSQKDIKIISFNQAASIQRKLNKQKNLLDIGNLSLDITNTCNLRCKQCNIWHDPNKGTLSLTDIQKIFLSKKIYFPVRSISLTGGEFMVHPQIKEIMGFLFHLKKNNKILNITFITNGYFGEKFKQLLLPHKEHLQNTEVYFSIDGTKDVHNELRGNINSYQNIMESILLLNNNFPEIKLTLKCTINAQNIKEIIPLYHLSKKLGTYLAYKLYESDMNKYYHKDGSIRHDELALTNSNIKDIIFSLQQIMSMEKNQSKEMVNKLYCNEIIRRISNPQEQICCITPKRQLFIDFQGNVYPCLYMNKLTNIHEDNWDQHILDKEHQDMIEKGILGKCAKCLAYHGYLKSWNLILPQ